MLGNITMHMFYGNRHYNVYLKACSGDLLARWTEYIDNTEVPLFLIGEPAYPLLPWLMKAYSRNDLTEEQKLFNYRVSRARMTVECSFGRHDWKEDGDVCLSVLTMNLQV